MTLYAKLYRDRRMGVIRKKEKALLQLIVKKNREQKDEYIKVKISQSILIY